MTSLSFFLCFVCGKIFGHVRDLNRHDRVEHNFLLCFACDFSWGRSDVYRAHVVKYHPGVDADVVFGKPAGSRRRTIAIARHPQRQPVVPPESESPIGILPVIPVAHAPQLEYPGLPITSPEHEDSHVPYTGSLSSFSFIEEWAQSNDLNINQGGPARLAQSLSYATYVISDP